MALVALAACRQPVQPLDQLQSVEPPPDLGRLEEGVREQFDQLWEALHQPAIASDSRALGRAWGALGQWYHVYSYDESAIACYKNAQLLDSKEPRWPYFLGTLSEQAGDLESAEREYERASKLAPGEVSPLARLGDLALRRQDLLAAEAAYHEILTNHPDDPSALLGIGRVALLRGDPRSTVEILEPLVARQPEAAPVHYTLGLAFRALGDKERADDELGVLREDTLDQVPLAPDAPWDDELKKLDRGSQGLTFRGVIAFRRGDTRRAAALLGAAVAANPNGAEERINYAHALAQLGNTGAAFEELQEALRLADEDSNSTSRAHFELGRLLARRQPQAAITQLEAALVSDPKSVPAHLELGKLLQHEGRLEESLEHYRTVDAFENPPPGTRFWHAAILAALGRHDQAVAVLEDELRPHGDDRRLRLLLARLLSSSPDAELRDVPRAQSLLEASRDPLDVLFAETAAMVAAADGNTNEAIAWQRAAIDVLTSTGPRNAAHIARRRLELYENGRPCRNPWERSEVMVLKPVKEAISR